MGPAKGGQQGGVDVDHAAREAPQQRRRHDAVEAGQLFRRDVLDLDVEQVRDRLGQGAVAVPDLLASYDFARTLEQRDDVLVYTTPKFKEDFEVTGPVALQLYASSSAVDTDFTAKLLDVPVVTMLAVPDIDGDAVDDCT